MSDWNLDKLKFENETDLIKENYHGSFPRQMPIYISIDWENKTISAFTRNYQIGGTPAREWNGIVSVYKLPRNIDAKELKSGIEEHYLKDIETIGEFFDISHNGHNFVGSFPDHIYEYELKNFEYDMETGSGLYTVDEEICMEKLQELGIWEE